jgi:hypothetical protein
MDGIVLCADSQESVGQYIKRNQPKLEVRPRFGHMPDTRIPCAVFAGSGDGDFIDFLVDRMWDAMDAVVAADKTSANMIAAADHALDEQYQRLAHLFPDGMPSAQFLVAVWGSHHDCEMVKITGPLLKRRVIQETIGFGNLLGTYISNRMLGNKVLIEQAMPVATYLIDQVREHVAECGGETHVVTLTFDGKLTRFNQFEMKDRSERLARIDEIARRMVAIAALEDTPDELFEQSMVDILSDLRKVRKKPK